jgi:hypothetical protein
VPMQPTASAGSKAGICFTLFPLHREVDMSEQAAAPILLCRVCS